MKQILLALLLWSGALFGEFADHLKKIEDARQSTFQVKKIDYIYLINLDKRPEKFARCMEQLEPYGIVPHRFSAIYGWDLKPAVLNELGVKFSSKMQTGEPALYFSNAGFGVHETLDKLSVGKTYFSPPMTPGAIGCTLSHLSVLQDAYDAGYETIWILEDDILLKKDPHLLSGLIEKLDKLTKKKWDVFYTDSDAGDKEMYIPGNDFESDLKGDLWYFSRPDLDIKSEKNRFAKRRILSEDFLEIGSRMRTHSMIIRRSGMKKILDFYKAHHMYIPYDHELATIPKIRLINLRYDLVTHLLSPSDTKVQFFPQAGNK